MFLSRAVEKTIKYAKFFEYSPSIREIHHWLIYSQHVSLKRLSRFFSIESTTKINLHSQNKIKIARQMAESVKNFPFIEMIAITGSVAVNNAKREDDIDLFIVTKENTLWIVRPFLLLYLSLYYKRRRRGDIHNVQDVFCPNLWLDESDLEIKDKNLYTAHEVLQILPVLNRNHTYEKFIKENSWTKNFLANAYHLTTHNFSPCRGGVYPARLPIKILNYIFYLLQLLYMLPYKTTEKISPHFAFLHTHDYSHLK